VKTLLTILVLVASALFGADRVADVLIAADRHAKAVNAALQARLDAARASEDR
jgi:hypothetical protein